MKILSLIFLTFLFGKGCDGNQQQELAQAVVTYHANTRGFYQKITVQNQMVTISNERGDADHPEARKIAGAAWKSLTGAFQEISLSELPNLKAPTQKRFYDGAAIATLTVVYKGQTYESAAFDHGEPPAEIKSIVNQILELAR